MSGNVSSPGSFLPEEFDRWAETYDCSIEESSFPFIGYTKVLDAIVRLAEPRPGLSVLDLGTGTGNLAVHFAALGCDLWCADFSGPMLERARAKLPAAHFALHDLRAPLPAGFDRRFDRIVSAYVFHHFTLEEKIRILSSLAARHLSPDGRLVIGDIAFPDAASRDQVREEAGEAWDEEFYWLADESIATLKEAGMQTIYQQVSACAGIFMISPY